jgi:N6-L-threonylcarbamoyladenine synthase
VAHQRHRLEFEAGVILAIETSCDDTCAAVITGDGRILANVISSQGIHDRYGGVVPEIASRQHLELIGPAVEDALAQAQTTLSAVDLVAVTRGPGLVAALLVGFATAKALAAAHELPLAVVDHLHGHVAAGFLGPDPVAPPFLCLVASGGHTFLARVSDRGPDYEVLGQTLDDAAGEAFDKGARLLGLGYPGGAALERLAREGDPGAFTFPTAARLRGLDFSFAGLKTSLLYRVRDLGPAEAERLRADLAASYQHAIVESLAIRTERALAATGLDRLAVGGGVAANGPLRARLAQLGVALHVPDRALCTDNAAMIASAARYVPALAYPHYLGLDVYATGERAPAAAAGRDPAQMPGVTLGTT